MGYLGKFRFRASKLFLVVAVVSSLSQLSPEAASAIYGGSPALQDSRVVALVNKQDNPRSVCSGALLAPQIVVAAAHCLGNVGFTYTSSRFTPKDLWIAQPGANLNSDDTNSRVRVLRAIVPPGYNNTYDPEHGNIITQKDDIAFYFLERPLIRTYRVEVASADDVLEIKQHRLLVTHIGYGLQDVNVSDGIPYSLTLKAFSQGSTHFGVHPAREENTIATEETGVAALCPGDSGGPWYATVGGVQKIVAVTVAASGCRGQGSGLGGAFGTLIHPYLGLMSPEWTVFLSEVPALLKGLKDSEPVIDFSQPLIQRSGGCDAYVQAELQILKDDKWIDFMPAQGWRRVPTCPVSNPYQPWVRAQIATGVEIRWHIYEPGKWDWYTTPEQYTAPKVTPVKAPTTPVPNVNKPKAKVLIKSRKLTCVKGNKIIHVSGSSAKCPAGFKAR